MTIKLGDTEILVWDKEQRDDYARKLGELMFLYRDTYGLSDRCVRELAQEVIRKNVFIDPNDVEGLINSLKDKL